MLSPLAKANLYLNLFSFTKVPLIWLCRPKILVMNDEKVIVKIPLKRRTKNHLNSMYFGALAVGADVAGGFLAMSKAQQSGHKISLAFKEVEAQFIKRPEGDVLFSCDDGKLIDDMLAEAMKSGERVNKSVKINVTCPSINEHELMAWFKLTLSIKVIN
ncbi:PaaI family thioesterase [Vibrio sp. MA40-2]|uniref:PaaI family thioesterase n=1 Tax=Vibrio sp. MA40-2 TaxID=3391828 RepID=UPI0039A7028A